MTNETKPPDNAAKLRQQAEAIARQQAAQPPETLNALSLEEARQTLHELRVHQIELEMQNEELRRAQAELDAVRARYFDLYDLAPVGYCTLSGKGLILQANLAASALLGMPRSALIQQPLSRFILKQDHDSYYLHSKLLFETGGPQRFELRLLRKDGTASWVQLDATSAQETDGLLVYRVALSDITGRKKVEEALQQMTNELKRSNADLQQFSYVASHDLQEPLRAVGGFVKLLQLRFPDKLDAKALEYITGAVEGVTRMESLINDLLTYSRVGAPGDGISPVDLNMLLNDALKNLQAGIESTHAKVTTDHLPTIPVNASQVTRLFQNLIGNAIKFSGERPPEIHIGARQETGQWLFWVRDNGIGIDPQFSERIFLIFQRLHTRKAYPGTGVGLAVCKRIVERHGGTIRVESQLGQGSTFHFSLPNSGVP
jgi:two-component system, chemotaxis family, sensor kinase Cph1